MRMGATHFLTKRLPNVATEMSLNVLAYNLTRVMNIVGISRSWWQFGPEELVLLCASCDRSGRSAWPEAASGLTPDSIQKKYAQTVVSTRIVPGCVQFLGEESVFTQPGPNPDLPPYF